ncbi:MAG: ATP-binding protein [Spirochaetota bacterium]
MKKERRFKIPFQSSLLFKIPEYSILFLILLVTVNSLIFIILQNVGSASYRNDLRALNRTIRAWNVLYYSTNEVFVVNSGHSDVIHRWKIAYHSFTDTFQHLEQRCGRYSANPKVVYSLDQAKDSWSSVRSDLTEIREQLNRMIQSDYVTGLHGYRITESPGSPENDSDAGFAAILSDTSRSWSLFIMKSSAFSVRLENLITVLDREIESRILFVVLGTFAAIGFVALLCVVLVFFIHRQYARSRSEMDREQDFSRKLIQSSPSLIVGLDDGGVIQFANPSAEMLLAPKNGTAVGENLMSLVLDTCPPEICRERFGRFLMRTGSGNYQTTFTNRNGKKCTVIWSSVILQRDGRRDVSVVCFGSDTSSLEEKEEQLQHTQKMEAIGTLAGGIAHDFNNVLSGISGGISMMRYALTHEGTRDDVFDYLDIINRSVKRATELIRRLGILSYRGDEEISVINLSELTDHILHICSTTFDKSITIAKICDDDSVEIRGNAAQLEQSLLNLCINAQHAMTIMRPDGTFGGKLTIHVYRSGDNQACVSVSDTGVGMEPEVIERMYEPFFTTKSKGKGSGLGLSMVHTIVQKNNGKITVSSSPGKGSEFILSFPLYRGPRFQKEEGSGSKFCKGSGTVLVVVDDEILSYTITQMLLACGYTILSAESCTEAWKYQKSHHNAIDAIIVDGSIPGCNLDTVCEKIWPQEPDMSVRVLAPASESTYTVPPGSRSRCAILVKPFTIEEISSRLHSLLTGNAHIDSGTV